MKSQCISSVGIPGAVITEENILFLSFFFPVKEHIKSSLAECCPKSSGKIKKESGIRIKFHYDLVVVVLL